jgi:hypothetical protein
MTGARPQLKYEPPGRDTEIQPPAERPGVEPPGPREVEQPKRPPGFTPPDRGDEVEQAWAIVDPIREAWDAEAVPLGEYPAGSTGPGASLP